MTGMWEEWLSFFLNGVAEPADLAVSTAKRLLSLLRDDREKLTALGKVAGSAVRILEQLQKSPILSVAKASEGTGLSVMTCGATLQNFSPSDSFARSPAARMADSTPTRLTSRFSAKAPSRFSELRGRAILRDHRRCCPPISFRFQCHS